MTAARRPPDSYATTVDVASADRQAGASSRVPQWEPAVDHLGVDAKEFFGARWGSSQRRVLLIAGAGFDPRATRIPSMLSALIGRRLSLLLVREHRPDPDPTLAERAERNFGALSSLVADATRMVLEVPVFGVGGAVTGGRTAAQHASQISLDNIDDVVIDFSALSIGISFPLTAVLMERAATAKVNVHAVVLADPALDSAIRPLPAEASLPIHGFHHRWRLDELEAASKLWLPQLATGQRELLDRIFREVEPHDICPILPFPAADPQRADRLIQEYLAEFESGWEVDQRSIIFAAENSSLDVYRTILALDDERRPVFDGHGGSVCVLSPVGSKVLALGALMAAMQRTFPVLYVEAVGYQTDLALLDAFASDGGELVHVWLSGEPYSPAAVTLQ